MSEPNILEEIIGVSKALKENLLLRQKLKDINNVIMEFMENVEKLDQDSDDAGKQLTMLIAKSYGEILKLAKCSTS
jgi:hypothetical protein